MRELENLKNTNKELMMFISVLAKMVSKTKKDFINNLKSKDDKLIANVLVDYQNRADMIILKEQSIINDYVKPKKIKILKEKLEKGEREDTQFRGQSYRGGGATYGIRDFGEFERCIQEKVNAEDIEDKPQKPKPSPNAEQSVHI